MIENTSRPAKGATRMIEQYRKNARECLEMAKRLDRPQDRQALKEMAKTWETLASLRKRDTKRRQAAGGHNR